MSYDKNVKAPLYAESGVPEYWQVDIKKQILMVRTRPKDGQYRSVRVFRRGETITLEKLPTFSFAVDEILGPAR